MPLSLFYCVAVLGTLVTVDSATDRELENALQDRRALLRLFRENREDGRLITDPPHVMTTTNEKQRLMVFEENIREILETNRDPHIGYTAALNHFSTMTDAERSLYTGFNATQYELPSTAVQGAPAAGGEIPESVDWLSRGYVTRVSDQGMCGSCWTFAGVGPLEARYALATGTLKKLSEQEALECVYDRDEKNGCRGGQYFHQWDWYKREGRAVLAESYPYSGKIFSCRTKWYPNQLTHAAVSGYSRCESSEGGLAVGLSTGPVAVGLRISRELYQYKTGIFMKEDCGSPANHAVVAVGYTKEFYRLKNSWGGRWGESGFVRWSRADHTMCDIHLWGAVPSLKLTNTHPDLSPAVDCKDLREDCEEQKEKCGKGAEWKLIGTGCAATCGTCGCQDAMEGCGGWAEEGYCTKPNYHEYMTLYCPLSCRRCTIHPTIDDPVECEDVESESKCTYYKSIGYCETYPKFVSTRCRKTCKLCGSCEDNGMVFCHGECRHAHMC